MVVGVPSLLLPSPDRINSFNFSGPEFDNIRQEPTPQGVRWEIELQSNDQPVDGHDSNVEALVTTLKDQVQAQPEELDARRREVQETEAKRRIRPWKAAEWLFASPPPVGEDSHQLRSLPRPNLLVFP